MKSLTCTRHGTTVQKPGAYINQAALDLTTTDSAWGSPAEMALEVAEKGGVWRRYAPHVQMTLAQLCYTLMYFITEASFNRGLNPYVYVTYRHLLVAVLIWPFAYYHER